MRRIVLNKMYGVLTPIELVTYTSKSGRVRYKYICKCSLCGGYHSKYAQQLHNKSKCTKHGNNYKHGDTHTKLYNVWYAMRQRCYYKNDVNYRNYGGRGIKVCNEWLADYITFKKWSVDNGYRDDLTIDRIDVDGDYTPKNCRWVDMITQANNKRNNIYFTYNNKTQTIKQWSRELGISYKTVTTRMYRGYPLDVCLGLTEHRDKRLGVEYTVNDITGTVAYLSKYYDVNVGTVRGRLRRGLNIYQALGVEKHGNNTK